MKSVLYILIFIPFVSFAQFGNQDFGIWGGVDVSTKLTDELKISGDLQIRTDDNSSRVNQYFLDLGVKYKVNKNFSTGINWRPRMVNDWSNYNFQNRLYLDLTGKLKLGDVALYLRNRVQSTLKSGSENPTFERLRFKAEFKLDNGLKAFIQDEIFLHINGYSTSAYTKNRFGIGLSYKVSDVLDLGLKYLRIAEVNRYYPLRLNVIAIKAGLSI